MDKSLFVGNLLYTAVSDCTLVGQLDAELTYKETFFNVLYEMLNNFLKRMVTPCFSTGSLCFDIKVSVEIMFADCLWSNFRETLTFVDFTLPCIVNSSNFKRLYPC